MSLVLVNVRTSSLPPSQLAAGNADVTWVVYLDGTFLRSFGSALGARTYMDGMLIRRAEKPYVAPPI